GVLAPIFERKCGERGGRRAGKLGRDEGEGGCEGARQWCPTRQSARRRLLQFAFRQTRIRLRGCDQSCFLLGVEMKITSLAAIALALSTALALAAETNPAGTTKTPDPAGKQACDGLEDSCSAACKGAADKSFSAAVQIQDCQDKCNKA